MALHTWLSIHFHLSFRFNKVRFGLIWSQNRNDERSMHRNRLSDIERNESVCLDVPQTGNFVRHYPRSLARRMWSLPFFVRVWKFFIKSNIEVPKNIEYLNQWGRCLTTPNICFIDFWSAKWAPFVIDMVSLMLQFLFSAKIWGAEAWQVPIIDDLKRTVMSAYFTTSQETSKWREMCWNLPLGTLSQPERLCRNKKLSIHFSTNLFAGFAGLDFGACAGPLASVKRRLLLC